MWKPRSWEPRNGVPRGQDCHDPGAFGVIWPPAERERRFWPRNLAMNLVAAGGLCYLRSLVKLRNEKVEHWPSA